MSFSGWPLPSINAALISSSVSKSDAYAEDPSLLSKISRFAPSTGRAIPQASQSARPFVNPSTGADFPKPITFPTHAEDNFGAFQNDGKGGGE